MKRGAARPLVARALPGVLACALLPWAGARAQDDAGLERMFGRGALVIEAGTACWHFDVYLARDGAEQRRGLMHVRSLPEFTGMLFVYGEPDRRSMWMKNTFIPLDMLFIRSDGTVSSIAENTEPLSLTSVSSVEPVTYVLELNAGVSEALAIGDGSRIVLPAELGTAR